MWQILTGQEFDASLIVMLSPSCMEACPMPKHVSEAPHRPPRSYNMALNAVRHPLER